MSEFYTPLKNPLNPDDSAFLGFAESTNGNGGNSARSTRTATKIVELASTVDDPELAKQIKSLARQRDQAMNKLLRIYTSVNVPTPIDPAQVKGHATKLQAAYNEYSRFHSEIVALIPEEEMDTQERVYVRFEKYYDFTYSVIEKRIMRQPPAPAQVIIHQQPLKAPIPTFDGEYTKWPKFKAMFLELMAQSRDSETIKLYHLNKALVGAAEGALDAKTINEGNYERAWEILNEQFGNQRVIVETHIRGLLSLKRMLSESHSELRTLLNECTNHVESLEYLKQPLTGVSELMTVHLLTAALDMTTRKLWEQTLKPGELPNYAATIAFLKAQCQVLERCESACPPATTKLTTKQLVPASKVGQRSHAVTANSEEFTEKCDFCGYPHRNYQCNKLNGLTKLEKDEKVRTLGLCFNCLQRGHRLSSCPSTKTCQKCHKRHHTQLHDDGTHPEQETNIAVTEPPADDSGHNFLPTMAIPLAPQSPRTNVTTTCSLSASAPKTVLLLTAVVLVTDRDNQAYQCRALLDSGSQANFITEAMANTLGLERKRANVPISGINNVKSLARDKVEVQFKSRCSEFCATLECLVTPRVTGTIPTTDIDISGWVLPDGIHLADPQFFKTNKVDMLIGAELFFALMKPGHITLDDDLPELRNSHLGWLVTGAYRPARHNEAVQYSHVASLESVEEAIRKFWELEEVPQAATMSSEEQRCENHFTSTYSRDRTGRFVVRLPLRENADNVDSCRNLALRRFFMLENRLQRNPSLKVQYVDFVREYLQLGHCREVNLADDNPNLKPYYLPHHAVLRPGSSSTKCRVVFDASAKSAPTNLSLNDTLLIGPVVQSDIFSIMLRFRQHRYVFTADIQKMYRQIRIHPDDTHKQRIYWREQPNEPLKILELLTVTYGTASAPFQATRSLVQLANEEAENFPVAAKITRSDCYVDDVLSGAPTLNDAIEALNQLKEMLARGGFPIHKWCSNSPEVLAHIPEEEREPLKPLADRHVNEVIKVLGLLWDPSADQLLIADCSKAATECDPPATKRIIYSEVAKHFDPLGLFSPSILLGKLLVQGLWQCKLDWNTPISDNTQARWNELKRELPKLLQIKIPRRVTYDGAVYYELHGFADASNVAYGANAYIQSVMKDGTARSRLLATKTKVAPLHSVTIPRKELCAALLLVRLICKILDALTLPLRKVVLYSDSEIVLAWLKKHPYQLETFVGNRVAQILALSRNFEWRYVRTHHNPADISSRGMLPGELMVCEPFWTGGEYINTPGVAQDLPDEIPDEDLPELKANVVVMAALIQEPLEIFSKSSSYRRLQQTVAWIMRFFDNARKPKAERNYKRHLTVRELRRSTNVVVRVIQHVELEDEIQRVRTNTPCKRIGELNPVLSDDGLLRVGGRLKHAELSDEAKHQLILPNSHPVTHNLIRDMHDELLHVGPAGLLSAIRQRFWLIRARSTIRQVTGSCVKCFRTNPSGISQLMGDLPKQRVTPSPVFSITGVDYAGPILVKQGTYRPKVVKAYIAVFVCMATKAIHLELVSDLTTDAFLAALQRFVSRRGLVSEMHSDNATNFHGADNELHRLYEMFCNQAEVDRIVRFCQVKEIQWHFIPPDSPEFGGLWEAAVKCTKTHLKRVIGNNTLNFEEMTTILCEIEAILNSRPLFAISGDPADPEVITPAHFLIGRPMIAVPEPSYQDLKIGRLSRWQHLQLLREQFWRAWSRDYLSSLQPRKKNRITTTNVRPGMIVLLQDKNRPPLHWKLGRITAVHPGSDNLVRVVEVFSEGSTYTRSITKLSILPIEENQGQPDQRGKDDLNCPGEDVPYGNS